MKNTLHRQLRIGDIILSAKPFIFMCEGKTESDLGSRVKKSVHRGRNKTGEKIGEEQYPQCWASRVQLLALDSHGSFQPWCKLTRFHDKPLCYVLFFFSTAYLLHLESWKMSDFSPNCLSSGKRRDMSVQREGWRKRKGKVVKYKTRLKNVREKKHCLSVCLLTEEMRKR